MNWKIIIFSIIGVLGFFFIIGLFVPEIDIQDDSTNEELGGEAAILYFYDNKTNCSLNGDIYSGDSLIGKVVNGRYNLSDDDFAKINPEELFFIQGRTDYCFGNNFNLPFYRAWTYVDWAYLQQYGGEEIFEVELTPRQPTLEEIPGFIRPEEVEERFSRIEFDEGNSEIENVDKILQYTYMNWASDSAKFGQMDYWQTPADFIRNKGGDCEDWAIYFISLIMRHNPELDCYLAGWSTHMNVICSIDKTYIIYDQNKIRELIKLGKDETSQETKIRLRQWRNGYFNDFGISPDEAQLFYLINQNEIILFEDGREDFIDWCVNNA